MSKYRAILFDMDGVLINSEPLYHAADQAMFQSLGIALTRADVEGLVGVNSREGSENVLRNHPELTMTVDAFNALYRDTLLGALQNCPDLRLVPGVESWFPALDAAGFTLALASSSTTPMVHYVADRLGLRSVMRCIVTGDMVTRAKPDPEIYLKAAEQIHVPPAACIVIEDSPFGIRAAKAAGMYCVAFTGCNVHALDNSQADVRIPAYDPASLARILSL